MVEAVSLLSELSPCVLWLLGGDLGTSSLLGVGVKALSTEAAQLRGREGCGEAADCTGLTR